MKKINVFDGTTLSDIKYSSDGTIYSNDKDLDEDLNLRLNLNCEARRKLYKYLKKRLIDGKMTYIFLDEVQNVTDFPKVLDSLYIKKNIARRFRVLPFSSETEISPTRPSILSS